MILLVIASVLLCQVFGQPIIGLQLSSLSYYPWLVSIQSGGRHCCSGSIISETIILTAANCVTNYPQGSLAVRAGSLRTDSGGSWHKVVAMRQHEGFTVIARKLVNDLALMKVSPPIKMDERAAKIELAGKWDVLATGTQVSIAGWDSLAHGGMSVQEVSSSFLRATNTRACSTSYKGSTNTWMSSLKQICAVEDGHGVCRGDSGSPLVDGIIQVGIVSWDSCLDPLAGVYTDVARYRDWIDENVAFMTLE